MNNRFDPRLRMNPDEKDDSNKHTLSRNYNKDESLKSLSYWQQDDDRDNESSLRSNREPYAVKTSSFIKILLSIIASLIVFAIGWFAYQIMFSTPQGNLIFNRPNENWRVEPENPGGTSFPHQDKMIYNRIGNGSNASLSQEALLPSTEEPILPPTESYRAPNIANQNFQQNYNDEMSGAGARAYSGKPIPSHPNTHSVSLNNGMDSINPPESHYNSNENIRNHHYNDQYLNEEIHNPHYQHRGRDEAYRAQEATPIHHSPKSSNFQNPQFNDSKKYENNPNAYYENQDPYLGQREHQTPPPAAVSAQGMNGVYPRPIPKQQNFAVNETGYLPILDETQSPNMVVEENSIEQDDKILMEPVQSKKSIISNDDETTLDDLLISPSVQNHNLKNSSSISSPAKIPASGVISSRSYRAQIGMNLPDRDKADRIWKRLKVNHNDILKNIGANLQPISTPTGGKKYRLIVGPFNNDTDANSLCSRFQGRQIHCSVLKPE
jgi:hypothetical protein